MMSRGLLSTNSAGEVVVEDTDLLNHPTLVGRQDWVSLDHRGNWKDFRDTVAGNPARTETRVANGVNEYTSINPGTPGSTLATKTLAYDKAAISLSTVGPGTSGILAGAHRLIRNA